ncbi:hypothetical protein [Nonomuraea sp. NPDC049725]|uniref:hypothetical protein n=1 Tax=Nonomuraea sp. NPDC049725 TaxID=3154508 RepID=UPI003433D0D1
MTSSETAGPPARTREAVLFTGLGLVADTAAVAQLAVSGSVTGILVTGLLAALLGFVLLLRRLGSALRIADLLVAVLIAVGAGTAGAAFDRLLTAPEASAAIPAASPTAIPASSAGGEEVTVPATPSPSTTATGEGQVTLADNDYLDLESGVVSEVNATADIVYNAPYTDLWTKGGGELRITPFDGTPTKAACAARLQRRHYGSVDAEKGVWYCLETTERNVAAVRVTDVSRPGGSVTLSYLVWKP